MKKSMLLLLAVIILSGLCAVEVTIGTGTSYNSNYSSPSPYANYYKNERDQYLITAAELNDAGGGGGNITSIAFNVYSVNSCGARPMTIKMGHTTATTLSTTFITGLTTVWTRTSYQPVSGWNTHTLDSAFNWDGTRNVVVEVFFGDTSQSYTSNASVYYTTKSNMALYFRSDTADANNATSGTLSSNRPNMKFNMQAYIPSVPGPATLVSPSNGATNVTLNATLNWSAGSGLPTGYKLYFGTDGNGTITPTNIEENYECGSSTTYSPASGVLQYATTYYWKIVPYNGAGSANIDDCPIWSFTTRADPTISSFPWIVDFGTLSADWPVLDWSQLTGLLGGTLTTGTQWFQDDFGNVTSPVNKSAKINIYGTTRYGWLITPPIAIPDTGYELKFDVALTPWNGTVSVTPGGQPDDRFIVLIDDNPNMSSPTILREWNNTGSTYVFDNITNTGLNYSIDLSSYVGTYYFAFYGESTVSNGDNDLFVDNVTVREIPAAPIISCTPDTWDFGTVLLGSSATKQFTISNTGGGKLMINSVETTGDYYSIISLPTDTELEAGENTNFTVKYEPGAESKGTHQGSVVIHYGDDGEKLIPLTGTCVDATIYEDDLPYTESFDGVTAPALPLGWTGFINSTSSSAVIKTYTYSSPYSTPNHIYMYNYDDNNAKLILISPQIDVPLNTLRTSFYAKGSTNYTLNIGTMSDPSNGDTFTSLTIINLTSTYTKYTINLNNYTGSDKYLAFKHGLGGTYRSIYIDNFLLEVAPSVVEPSNLTVSNITGNSAVLGWNENNVPPATTWDIIYGAPGFNPNGKATQIQVTSNPYTLTELQPNTAYQWYVRAVKDGNVSAWAGPSSFTTTQIPAELPFTEDFEGAFNWTIVNGTQTNQWYVGTATYYADSKSAYISNDNGVSNAYNTSYTSVVHLYRDIAFPAGALEYNLSFMFKCGGESTYDGLKVFLVDTSTIPSAGTLLTTGQIGNTWYNLTTNWTEKTITINNAVAGTTKRLVFSWRNDSSGGIQPPAAIDNIELTYTMPNPSPEPPSNPVPADGTADVPLNQILSWRNNGTVTKVDVYFGPTDNMVLVSENQTNPLNSYDPDLEYDKTYQWKIIAKNDADEIAEGPVWSFTTMADPTISVFPWIETFEDDSPTRANWTQIYEYGSDSWTFAAGAGSGAITTAHSGTKNARFVASYSGGITKLVTPPLNMAAGNYNLSFWYGQQLWDPDQNELKVYYRTSPTSSWIMLNHYTENINNWTLVSGIALPEPSSTYQIAFEGINNYGYPNVLDDIMVERIVDIPADQPIVIQGTTVTSTIDLDINETIDVNNLVVVSLPNYDNLTNPIVFGLTGTGTGTITIEVGPGTWYGVIYYSGAWNHGEPYPCVVGSGLTGTITFANVDFGTKGDVIVVVNEGDDPTLPVTLSNFTAMVTSENFVNIAWMAETETNHSGYNIFRNETKDLENAVKINAQLIDKGTAVGTQISYFYTDFEVYTNMMYYYWLESVALDGTSQFYGPLTVTIGDPAQEPLPPVVPMVTKLYNAFPNPFNPNTNIRYSLKEVGKVKIEIYNMKGQKIKTFTQEHNSPGYYQVSWDGRDENGRSVASGIYLYRLTTANYTSAKKMVLAK